MKRPVVPEFIEKLKKQEGSKIWIIGVRKHTRKTLDRKGFFLFATEPFSSGFN
ncbi:hypothetical protein NDK47_01905 [Brevibacillus ruminantium]|uniref:Uncharacterized protein n=1 Tax=Brevibacillus ruminantium TaxID=2950604 RepID=A0ABY4WJT1_9BACL|nr:hypothetical protein [Brevibacillus ruminantium]USG66115.1 hypothetical protein NDK47_01905 [Brevibacillus ruminantium]